MTIVKNIAMVGFVLGLGLVCLGLESAVIWGAFESAHEGAYVFTIAFGGFALLFPSAIGCVLLGAL